MEKDKTLIKTEKKAIELCKELWDRLSKIPKQKIEMTEHEKATSIPGDVFKRKILKEMGIEQPEQIPSGCPFCYYYANCAVCQIDEGCFNTPYKDYHFFTTENEEHSQHHARRFNNYLNKNVFPKED